MTPVTGYVPCGAWLVSASGDCLSKPSAVTILLFVLLFEFRDAFADIMTVPFVIRLGLGKLTCRRHQEGGIRGDTAWPP
ncbi:MAG: hypothetical protein V6Z86_02240 [Hyphomicrobiales bacterium]